MIQEGKSHSEWKDCKVVGGQDAYCGCLKIEKGLNQYRMKIDRYGNRQNNKEWDVFIIKKSDRNQIKWYDMTHNN